MAGKMPLTRSRKRSLEESNAETISDSEDESIPECAVCLQECSHPCRLPCGHIFCFLCVKGVSLNIPNCPMCRANIPRGYFDNPDILSVPKKNPAPSAEGYKWYYEGRHGGWWEYDGRTSADLEEALKAQERSIQVLIAGTVYTIDLIDMVQTKPDGRSSRRIKRSLQPIPTKGIAGIRKHRRLPQPPLVLVPVVERFVSDLDDDDDDEFNFGPEFEDDDDYGDDPVLLSSESEPEIYDDAEPDIDDDPDVSDVDDEPEVNSDSEPENISEPEIISDDEPESNEEIYIDSESDAGCSDYGPDDDDDVSDDYFGDDFDDCDDFF